MQYKGVVSAPANNVTWSVEDILEVTVKSSVHFEMCSLFERVFLRVRSTKGTKGESAAAVLNNQYYFLTSYLLGGTVACTVRLC